MSVIVTANYKGETFEVEIFRDGSIDFPDRDLQYEQAMAEFYPPGSPVVRLHELWDKFPVLAIFDNAELPKDARPRLTTDFAEHVLHVFESVHQEDGRPRAAIEAARDFLDGKIDQPTLEMAEAEATRAVGYVEAHAAAQAGARIAGAARAAAWAVAGAARAAAWMTDAVIAAETTARSATRAAAWAVEAAACNTTFKRDSLEWQQAHDAEVAWQIRRFVDCMEAIGLGKDWPDLKVTT